MQRDRSWRKVPHTEEAKNDVTTIIATEEEKPIEDCKNDNPKKKIKRKIKKKKQSQK